MNEIIHRLVYYSRNREIRSPEEMAVAINNILAASRRNNARVNVTGALMFNVGCFGQVLEGPKAAVEHTFERIQQDERHGDVSVIGFGPVAGRAFDRWSMGFVGESAKNARRYSVIAGESGYDPTRMTSYACSRPFTGSSLRRRPSGLDKAIRISFALIVSQCEDLNQSQVWRARWLSRRG